MALPPNVRTFQQALDPQDELDWYVVISRDDKPDSILMPDETIASYSLGRTPEAVLAGLELINDPVQGFITRIENYVLVYYARIALGKQGDASFQGAGSVLGLEIKLKTDSVPPRTKQRTIAKRVQGQ